MVLTKKIKRETGRDYALRTLRENIVHLELAPGSMVGEVELASQMGLSRTPVREALIELSKTEIVTVYPQKGSRIAYIDEHLIEEVQFMRNVLECAVVEQACACATEEDIVRLRENVSLQRYYLDRSSREAMELDRKMHKMLFEITDKLHVYQQMQPMMIHCDRLQWLSYQTVDNRRIVGDHEELVERIARRDASAACEMMETHLNYSKVDVIEISRRYPQYFHP